MKRIISMMLLWSAMLCGCASRGDYKASMRCAHGDAIAYLECRRLGIEPGKLFWAKTQNGYCECRYAKATYNVSCKSGRVLFDEELTPPHRLTDVYQEMDAQYIQWMKMAVREFLGRVAGDDESEHAKRAEKVANRHCLKRQVIDTIHYRMVYYRPNYKYLESHIPELKGRDPYFLPGYTYYLSKENNAILNHYLKTDGGKANDDGATASESGR